MTNMTGACPEPAWDNPSQVRLYDGMPFLRVAVDVLPGFAIIELANRAASTLASVSCVITPIKGTARLLTRLVPIVIQPSSRAIVPVAYACGGTCECQVLVTFTRDVTGSARARVHACQARACLMPISREAFHLANTWRPLLPRLARKEFRQAPGAISPPPAIIDKLASGIGGKMQPLEGSIDVGTMAYGCLVPVLLVVVPEAGTSFTLYGADLAQLDAAANARDATDAKAREAGMFELGVAVTTLRDGLALGTKTDHVRPAGYRVARLVEALGLHVPTLGQLLGILEHRESLGDLPASDRSAYEQGLVEVERLVLGHPS